MNSVENRRDKFCVIGAGASGLPAMKYLKEWNIPFDGIEAAYDIGGIWIADRTDSPMYKNTHLISPKQVQAFSDFPMPDSYPDFPNHELVLEYLRSYAKHFKLYSDIQFNTLVERIEPIENYWNVTLKDGIVRQYRGVVVANGHHTKPKYPKFPGTFTGEILHSRDYREPQQLCNKRVLVVGSGQSAIDIAVESAIAAKATFHSTRRNFICLKKYFMGIPTEYLVQNLPVINNLSVQTILKVLGTVSPLALNMEGIDLEKWHIPFGSNGEIFHPIVGDKIYRYYADGDVVAKPEIKELLGDRVLFKDNTEESIDLIIYATGYHLSFPFIDKQLLNWQPGKLTPDLFLYIFHPHYDNLFFIGMVNPIGAHWTVHEEQSLLVANYIKARDKNSKVAQHFEQIKLKFKPEDNDTFNALRNSQKYPLIIDKKKYSKSLKKYIKIASGT